MHENRSAFYTKMQLLMDKFEPFMPHTNIYSPQDSVSKNGNEYEAYALENGRAQKLNRIELSKDRSERYQHRRRA